MNESFEVLPSLSSAGLYRLLGEFGSERFRMMSWIRSTCLTTSFIGLLRSVYTSAPFGIVTRFLHATVSFLCCIPSRFTVKKDALALALAAW
jgi:hypothetical protein